MKDLSIIIVAFNQGSMLRRCVESLIKFISKIDYEIIIVDNASKDIIISDFLPENYRIRLIKNKVNRGFGAANNLGFQNSEGKEILFLNDDTELIDNSLDDIYQYKITEGRNAVVGCQLLNSDLSNQESVMSFPSIINVFSESFFFYKIFKQNKVLNRYAQNNHLLTTSEKTDVVKGAFLLINRVDFEKIGGFDERFFFYYEETDLCKRFKDKTNGDVIFLPQYKIIHHGSASTGTISWFKFKHLALSKLLYFRLHFNFFEYSVLFFIHYFATILRGILNLIFFVLTFNKSYLIKSKFFIKQLTLIPKI